MSSRTPNYITTEEINAGQGYSNPKIIPIGSLVKLVQRCYVPAHVLEDDRWKWHGKDYVFIYTRHGFVSVNKTTIRELD